jgi:hypothetical protein
VVKFSHSKGSLFLLVLTSSACELVAGIGDRKVSTGGVSGYDAGAGGDVRLGTGGRVTDGSAGFRDAGSGGMSGTGGLSYAGGAIGFGGAIVTGGMSGMGGIPSGGGITSMGGFTGTGGKTSTGGVGGSGGIRMDASITPDAITDGPSTACQGNLGDGSGLLGEYFVSASLTGLQLSRIDSTIDFNWPAAPDLGVPADQFSVRWTGQVQPRFTGRYTFYTQSDDGIRLWIKGTLLIDHWNQHGTAEDSGQINLVAGQKYDIKLEYFDQSQTAVVQLSWMSECQAREVIPSIQLYPPAAVCTAPGEGTGTGLKGEYYDDVDLSDLRNTRLDSRVSFVWADGVSPDPSVAPGTYSVRWTGQVQAPYSGWTTFYTVSDDGARLFIDDSLVIDNWDSHPRTENQATINLVAGQMYNLRLEYFEKAEGGQIQLLWGSQCQRKDLIPQTQLFPAYGGVVCTDPVVGNGTGLKGAYYNNDDFTNLAFTHAAEAVDFDWGDGAPDPAIGADTFSVRWTGRVQAQTSGIIRFWTSSDDGVRLWIDGNLIIDDWTDHQVAEDVGNITLTEGQTYDVRLDYREKLEKAIIKLSWSGPCQTKKVIPKTQLYPLGNGAADAGVPDAAIPEDAASPVDTSALDTSPVDTQ